MTIKELEELKAIEQEKWEAYEEWESKLSEVRSLEEQEKEICRKIRAIRDQYNFYTDNPFADWIKANKAVEDYKKEYFAQAGAVANLANNEH